MERFGPVRQVSDSPQRELLEDWELILSGPPIARREAWNNRFWFGRSKTMIPRLGIALHQFDDGELKLKDGNDKQGSDASPSASPPDDQLKRATMGTGGWQLHRANECHGRKLELLETDLPARHWLQALRPDAFAMQSLRKALLIEGLAHLLTRMRDQDVIEQVYNLLKSGRWHICEPLMLVCAVSVSTEKAIAPVRNKPRQPQPPPTIREIPDIATLAGSADQSAIAGVLKDAARLGVPMCEECLKGTSSGGCRN